MKQLSEEKEAKYIDSARAIKTRSQMKGSIKLSV